MLICIILIGVSSQAAGHRVLVPELINELKKRSAEHIRIVVGGVIPPQDYSTLKDLGVIGVFGPGTKIDVAAKEIIEVLTEQALYNIRNSNISE
jgi:methylmalonyl-CoA mutase